MESLPTLYVLARVDLASMNSGKLAAQTCHSGSAFAKHMENSKDPFYEKWKEETPQGFGTVLVLAVNEQQMRQAVETSKALGFVSGVVHDPTYPLRDGDTTHFLPVDTCAYVFGSRLDPMLKAVVGNFPLHP